MQKIMQYKLIDHCLQVYQGDVLIASFSLSIFAGIFREYTDKDIASRLISWIEAGELSSLIDYQESQLL